MAKSESRVADRAWLTRYFEQYRATVLQADVLDQLVELRDRLRKTHARGGKVILAGNGGSAAMASHCAVDFTKVGGIRAINFNEADLITCFANDYGYERWVEKALESYADAGDCVILISSSGKSPNIVNAARAAKARGLEVVTFTGFEAGNPLRAEGALNFWVNSRSYNVIEMTHHIWLLAVCDLLADGAKKPASARTKAGAKA